MRRREDRQQGLEIALVGDVGTCDGSDLRLTQIFSVETVRRKVRRLAPILKSGAVQIRFKVLPNGTVTDMVLEGRSGDTGLDRAAWGAITGSSYPPLPREFHGPYLELRALFLYNEQQK